MFCPSVPRLTANARPPYAVNGTSCGSAIMQRPMHSAEESSSVKTYTRGVSSL